ncbi:ATP-grasp domain-containing protein [Allocatelliglobosispora scoriae]|nr:ATP-grasp domain-containing protein [Allocatelliglobosispora scoriae]
MNVVTPADTILPAGSVLYVEEPEVAERNDAAGKLAALDCVRELVTWEYQVPGAAERFHDEHPDEPVVAVIPAMEYAVPFAARLAELYGVPGATLTAAETLRDKGRLRAVTAAAGIANPASASVASPDDVRAFAERHPGRIIIKPSNRQATIGTWIIDGPGAIDEAWTAAIAQDESMHVPDRGLPLRMLAEQFVTGPEYSVEMLVHEGRSRFANVTDKVLFDGPRPIERGHVVPADIPDPLHEALVAATARVAGAVGFRSGFLHCEWIVAADGTPYLVECAGRLPGDMIVLLMEYAWPINITSRYFDVMQGVDPGPAQAAAAAACAVWFLAVDAGVVECVDGLDDAADVPDVVRVECLVAPGDEVHELRSSWDRAAYAMSWAPTPEEAREAAELAIAKIHVKVRELP